MMARVISVASGVLSIFCVSQFAVAGSNDYLSEIEKIHAADVGQEMSKNENLRVESIREAGLSLGTRSGLAWESKRINESLDGVSDQLDRIFDFRGLALDGGRVIPPVILAAKNATVLDTPTEMRRVDVSWHIVRNAQLTTVLPNWRSYVYRVFPVPDAKKIPNVRLPRNDEEEKIWKKAVDEGFTVGVAQARQMFSLDLRRLERDWLGMLRFHALSIRNVVSLPIYTHSDVGVVKHAKQARLETGVRVYRISMPSDFKENSGWKTLPLNDGK